MSSSNDARIALDRLNGPSPGAQGYRFPAEWAPHRATWLSWIHKEASWPGKLESAYTPYVQFIKHLAEVEEVCINLNSDEMEEGARRRLGEAGVRMERVKFYRHPTNDAWCRDHGPAFLLHNSTIVGTGSDLSIVPQQNTPVGTMDRSRPVPTSNALPPKIIIDWAYNAWGGKYPPFEEDDQIPTQIAAALGLPVFYPGIVMEGGSVEFNGAGTLLTTKACLLNENRNPHLNQQQIEQHLAEYYGVEQILWLEDGIEGDDTDGHIDDLTRFVHAEIVVTVLEENRLDNNYHILKNLDDLKQMRLLNGQRLEIVPLPTPGLLEHEGQRLPASYANFYIANSKVIVPTFEHKNDDKALRILEECFPGRSIIGIDSVDLIWGLGAFHCLSQQEPL